MSIAKEYLDTNTRNVRRKMHKLLGKVSLIKPIIQKLKIGEITEEILSGCPNHVKISNGKASEIMVLNRLVSPMPMYNIEEWVATETCVGDIYEVECGSMNDDRIGHLLDDTQPHISKLWNEITSTAISEFDIPFDRIYNDITSLYFEGAYEESDIITHGYSRDQKPDKKQVNLDINTNVMGIPLVYSLLSGETADKSTVIDNMENIIKTLKKSNHTGEKPLVVGDRAMLDNKIVVAYHKRDDLDYLGTLKLTKDMKEAIAAIPDEEFKLIRTKTGDGLYEGFMTNWTFTYQEDSYTDKVLVVKSEQKLQNDINQRKKVIDNYVSVLEDLKRKLNGKRYKTAEAVEKRIEPLKKEYKGSKYIDTWVSSNIEGKIALEYSINQEAISKAEKLDGKYMMATNRLNMTAQQMLAIYKARDISEKAFSILKGTLMIRPIFLQTDERIESLVFFSLCALLVYNILKLKLMENEIELSVNRALDEFKVVIVGYDEFIDGSILRMVSDLTDRQREILDKLEFPYPSQYVNFAV